MKKKTIMKRILLCTLTALLLWGAADICITEIAVQKIPHHYASAEEGRTRLLANTSYYDRFSQNDIAYRMQRSDATIEELLDATTAGIGDFHFFEKYLMDRMLVKMERKLRKNGCTLPQIGEITYIKTDMRTEGANSGYTHGREIYLNAVNVLIGCIPGIGEYFEHLMWHEMFHCLSRNDPAFRAEMYSLIHFTVNDTDFELPPCVRDRYFINPDVEHHDAYATFRIDGTDTECFLVWVCKEEHPGEGSGSGFDNEVVLVPTDGSDVFYTREQASNFDEIFGENTDYVIDPEECMADNFADAMQFGIDGADGQGYRTPAIIEGVLRILSE